MDNPNVKAPRRNVHTTAAVNLRRHKSLPGPLRSIRPQRRSTPTVTSPRMHHLHHSKSNPYVGWFRHSPPNNNKYVLCLLDPSTVLHKKRRYVAKGHHLRSIDYDERMKTWLQIKQLLALKDQLHSTTHNNKQDIMVLDLLKKRGFLRGGGQEEQDLETFLQDQCAGSESVTVKVLSRLACWFLDVPLETTPQPPKYLDNDSASLVSDNDEDSEYDNYDTVSGSRQRSDSAEDMMITTTEEGDNYPTTSSTLESSMVLSSQAEAYYALTAVCTQLWQQQEESSSSLMYHRHRSGSLDDSSSRLDYDITQMDIVRMSRIASRHLDVESIVRLPVLTYTNNNDPAAVDKDYGTDSASPLPCPDRRDDQQESRDAQDTTNEEEKHDTEFSWMLVPPPQQTHSFDDSSDHNNHYYQDATATPSERAKQQQQPEHRDFCVICLEHFVAGDRLRVLPCTHSFHMGCIDRWLSGSHSFDDCYTAGCPTCKKRPTSTPRLIQQQQLHQSDGSVPSWAFARIGDVLARESRHF